MNRITIARNVRRLAIPDLAKKLSVSSGTVLAWERDASKWNHSRLFDVDALSAVLGFPQEYFMDPTTDPFHPDVELTRREQLILWRMEAGLTQCELSMKFGKSPTAVSLLESGARSISDYTMNKIAACLGKPIPYPPRPATAAFKSLCTAPRKVLSEIYYDIMALQEHKTAESRPRMEGEETPYVNHFFAARYLSIMYEEEAAQALGIPEETLLRWEEDGHTMPSQLIPQAAALYHVDESFLTDQDTVVLPGPHIPINQLIAYFREQLNISVEDTAVQLGLNPSTIYGIEYFRSSPTPTTLAKMVDFYHIPQDIVDNHFAIANILRDKPVCARLILNALEQLPEEQQQVVLEKIKGLCTEKEEE